MGLATGDVVLVTYWANVNAQTVLQTLRHVVTVSDTTTSVQQDLASFAAWFTDPAVGPKPLNKLLLCQSQDLDYNRLTAQRVYPARTTFWNEPFTATGGDMSSCDAQNIAASLTKRSLFPGRKGVGRIQIGGLGQDAYLAGELTNAFQTLANAYGASLLGSIPFPGTTMRARLCTNGGINALDSVVFSCDVQETLRTMRRRTVGLGI